MSASTRIDFATLCAEYPLPELAAQSGIKLKRQGREYAGCCPFHAENSPSFTIYFANGRWRYKCFGCGANGDSVAFISQRYNVGAREAVRILRGTPPPALVAPTPTVKKDLIQQIEKARALYRRGYPASGTIVERYLEMRGIDLALIGGVPASLKYLELDYWTTSADGIAIKVGQFPAMLAPIQQADGKQTGVHITYLDPESGGKMRLDDTLREGRTLPAKKVRGVKMGGCIRLAPIGPRLLLAEGIETALSVRTALARARSAFDAPAWTCVDLDNFAFVRLPPVVREVFILGDNDMKNPRPGQRDPRQSLKDSARKLASRGLRVRLAWANAGTDFNDMLTGTPS